jgi:hypothetical protein
MTITWPIKKRFGAVLLFENRASITTYSPYPLSHFVGFLTFGFIA